MSEGDMMFILAKHRAGRETHTSPAGMNFVSPFGAGTEVPLDTCAEANGDTMFIFGPLTSPRNFHVSTRPKMTILSPENPCPM
jgi:hypothetical protein